MGLAVLAYRTRSVDAYDDMIFSDGYIMYQLVYGSLQE